MNHMFILMTVIPALLLVAALRFRIRTRGSQLLANNAVLVNIFHKGRTTGLASSAAFTQRYLLCKYAGDGLVDVCGASDTPYGVVPDMNPTTDTDLSYPLPVNLLGLNEDSERMIASAAITAQSLVVPAAGGQIQALPSGAGTYWVVGRAVTAAINSGDQVNVIPCFPFQVTVA
jgi:hypothetical protein